MKQKTKSFVLLFLTLLCSELLLAQSTAWTAPTMDNFIGINILTDRSDLNKAAKFKNVRVFHDWNNDVGLALNTNYGVPLTSTAQKLNWPYNINGNRFLDYSKTYKQMNVMPCLNRPAPEFFGQTQPADFNLTADYRPVVNATDCSSPMPIYSTPPAYPSVTTTIDQNGQTVTVTTYDNDQKASLPNRSFDQASDYLQYAKWTTLFAAQFGSKVFAATDDYKINLLDKHLKQAYIPQKVGVKYVEIWNEADKWWIDQSILFHPPNGVIPPGTSESVYIGPHERMMIEDQKPAFACFRPREYAAMLGAAYDGHGKKDCFKIGTTDKYLGIKNVDPNMKVVFTGLLDFRHNYVQKTLDWLYGEGGRNTGDPVPFDVLNFHHYGNSAGGRHIDQNQFKEFIEGYNYAGAGGMTHGIFPEQNDTEKEQLRERVGELITALRTTSQQAAYSFDLNSKELWVSEFGYDAWDDPLVADQSGNLTGRTGIEVSAINNGDRQYTQGQWLTRSYLELAAGRNTDVNSQNIRGIDKAFMYKLNDDPSLYNNQFGYCGLLTADNIPKKSWYFIRTLQNVLKGYAVKSAEGVASFAPNSGQDPLANNLRAIWFQSGTGNPPKDIVAVWSASANDFKSKGTLTFPTTIVAESPTSPLVHTIISVEIPDEYGKRTVKTNQLNKSITDLTISETPIFIKLRANEPDPDVKNVTNLAVSKCYCSTQNKKAVELTWTVPSNQNYRYYRVYYRQFCGTTAPTPANALSIDPLRGWDLGTWTLYAENLPSSQKSLNISGLSKCATADTWYAFIVFPVGRRALTAGWFDDEILPSIPPVPIIFKFETTTNSCETNCFIEPNQYTISTTLQATDAIKNILKPSSNTVCQELSNNCYINYGESQPANTTCNVLPQNNPAWAWVANSVASNTFEMTFNTAQIINAIYLFTRGNGRLEIEYFDNCGQCWLSLKNLEFYQNTTNQWYILNAVQLLRSGVKKLRVKRTGLVGDDGVPGNGNGFAVLKFLICSEPAAACTPSSPPPPPQPIKDFHVEYTETNAAYLGWQTALIDINNPSKGVFTDYEVKYAKCSTCSTIATNTVASSSTLTINSSGNPFSMVQEGNTLKPTESAFNGSLTTSNPTEIVTTQRTSAEAYHRLIGLDPNAVYTAQVTPISGPNNPCTTSIGQPMLLTFMTEKQSATAREAKENQKMSELYNNIQILPNPVRDWLKVFIGDLPCESVEIISTTGKIIQQKYLSSNYIELNVSSLPAGVYYLRFLHPFKGVPDVKPFVKV